MFVPDFLFDEKNSILPLDATYVLNNFKYYTELNLHSIYPALFSRQTKEALTNFIALRKKSMLMLSESFYPGMQTLATKLMRPSSSNLELSQKYLSNYL
jgi:hypothetical protein